MTIPQTIRWSRRRFLKALRGSAIATLGSVLPWHQARGYPGHIGVQDGALSVDVLGASLRGLEAMVHPEDGTGLPYDIVNAMTLRPDDRVGTDDPFKSSGLEIALRLAGLIAQADLGTIAEPEAMTKAREVLATLSSDAATATLPFTDANGQPRSATFPYLWLDPRTGKRTQNREIPSIDNGQLAYSLATLTERFAGSEVADQAQALLDKMNFRLFLRDDGYLALKVENETLHGRIDIWGSEGIVTPLLGILKDGVPPSALPQPASSVVYVTPNKEESIKVVPTFGGSLFTALFPLLFWGTTNVPTPILENARRHVHIHWIEGQRRGLRLWGWAPAQDLNGRYGVFGVPAISQYFEPSQAVVAPYASTLALNLSGYSPAKTEIQAALNNLFRLMWSHPDAYVDARGFVDSAQPHGRQVAGNLLALDKGMEALSLYNYLQRETGKPAFDAYFWAYLDRIGQADNARDALGERGEQVARLIQS